MMRGISASRPMCMLSACEAPLRKLKPAAHICLATLIAVSAATSCWSAEVRNPFAGSAKAAKAGEYEFRINCALCHGLGARGGGRGPDLTRAHKRHGDSDADMFHNIS